MLNNLGNCANIEIACTGGNIVNYSRIIESIIENILKTSGALLIEGPKFCGKTTTCLKFAKSNISLNTKQTIEFAKLNTKGILNGDYPRLLDEWQTVPDIWNQVKNDLDKEYVFGKYILTGSTTPGNTNEIYHSGAGRITKIIMSTMSLSETLESKNLFSINEAFTNDNLDIADLNSEITLSDIAKLICRGGWPLSVKANDIEDGIEITHNYYNGLFNFEYNENERFRNLKNDIIRALLKSYARNISTEASNTKIITDISENIGRTIDFKTYLKYEQALKDLYIINNIDAWNPNIRSKTSIRTTPIKHFVDTSIACAALSIGPNDLLNDLKTFGLIFEDFVIHELRVYLSKQRADILHYRDNAGLECDAVIKLNNGDYALVEIKLGGDEQIDEAARHLTLLKNKIKGKSDEVTPKFLMIITSVGPLYKRKDGIYVVPINTLHE